MLGTDKEPGIYVRTLNDLFRAIEETSDDMLYSVSMSYLEVRIAFYTTCHMLWYYTSSNWPAVGQNVIAIILIAHSELIDFY